MAYVICEAGNAVARLDWDPATGLLAPVDWAADASRLVSLVNPAVQPPSTKLLGAELALSADIRFLYATTRGFNGGFGSVAVLAVDQATGALATPLQWAGSAGFVPRHCALAAGGRYLLAVNQGGGTVLAYRRDAATGLLQEPAAVLNTSSFVPQPAFADDVPLPTEHGGRPL